jgi:hypothetical protein
MSDRPSRTLQQQVCASFKHLNAVTISEALYLVPCNAVEEDEPDMVPTTPSPPPVETPEDTGFTGDLLYAAR